MLDSSSSADSSKSVVMLTILVVLMATQTSHSERISQFISTAPHLICQLPVNGTRIDQRDNLCSKSHLVSSCSHEIRNDGWSRDYYEEQTEGFELHIMDESFDERLANIIYTINEHNVFEMDSFIYNSGNPELDLKNMQAVAGPEVSETKCHKHLRQMVSLFDEMNYRLDSKRSGQIKELRFDERHFRLARVLDSFGRYEPGYLSGRTRSVGQFDQCLNSKLLLGERESESAVGNQPNAPMQKVETRYCWVGLGVMKHLNPALKSSLRSESGPAQARILVGACLPKSCHSRTLIKSINKDSHELVGKLINSQFRLPNSIYLDESLELDSIYCLVDRDSPHFRLPLSGKLILLFLVVWFVIAIYASINTASSQQVDFNEKTPLLCSVMDCLDIRRSIHDFLGRNKHPIPAAELEKQEILSKNRRVDLSALNPVKVFGCCFVVLGHSLIVQSSVDQNPLKTFHQITIDPIILLMIIGTFVVDTFIIITGILMGYATMKRANATIIAHQTERPPRSDENSLSTVKGKSTPGTPSTRTRQFKLFLRSWIKFTLNRHLALVPLLYLVFWFRKSVLINSLADRPLWDAGFNRNTPAGSCRQESWLSPLTMAAAFSPLSRQCLPQTWSVSTDLFFSLVIPPILLLMPRRPKLALFIGIIMALASNVLATMAYQALDPVMKKALDEMRFEAFTMMFGKVHHLYTYPQFRLSSILVGVLAGYYLFEYDEGRFEWPDWFRRTATRGTLMGLSQIVLLSTSLPYWKPFVHPYESLIFANAFTGLRVLLAIGNAILLMRMATDWRHNFIMKLAIGQFWRSMVKLNYAILLVHVDVLLYLAHGSSGVSYFSKQGLIADFASAYLYCIPLAMFLHIVYENPFRKLANRHLVTLLN